MQIFLIFAHLHYQIYELILIKTLIFHYIFENLINILVKSFRSRPLILIANRHHIMLNNLIRNTTSHQFYQIRKTLYKKSNKFYYMY